MNETEKEQALIEEGKINPIGGVRYVGVFPETYSKLISYLHSRPYAEVARLLAEMATNEKQIAINEGEQQEAGS